jgi:hypothetical protein
MWSACAGRLSERLGWHEASTTSGRLTPPTYLNRSKALNSNRAQNQPKDVE